MSKENSAEEVEEERPLTWKEERHLILHVCVPKLTRHLQRINKWIDNFNPNTRESFYELSCLPGAEGMAILIPLSEEERKATLSEHCKTDIQRFLLCTMVDRLGLPDSLNSPAAMIMRAFSVLDPKSKDFIHAQKTE